MKSVNSSQLLGLLRAGQVQVEFTKLDGSERLMLCTLQDAFLPEEYRGKGVLMQETQSAHSMSGILKNKDGDPFVWIRSNL